jgi:hypothetical protein
MSPFVGACILKKGHLPVHETDQAQKDKHPETLEERIPSSCYQKTRGRNFL